MASSSSVRRPLNVVLLEDYAPDAELVLGQLRLAGFDPRWKRVETEAEYLAALEPPPDLILADYALPQFDGFQALRLLRERGLDVPFILVSGTVGEEVAVDIMKEGAADYVLKDRLHRLGSAVYQALDDKRRRTEHERAEKYREMGRQVLQILNEPGTARDSMPRAIAIMKKLGGFDVVAIRLKDGEDFPYLTQLGFSDEFQVARNSLLASSSDALVCRDKEGRACLVCTCGLVISGPAGDAAPLLSPGGTFWTNDSLSLLDLPADRDPRLAPRNICIREGYASLALVPVRNDEGIVGLLQFNSRQKDFFIPEEIERLEIIATNVGLALERMRVEESLRMSLGEGRALLKEVHHRVKNNLQIISSLLRLEAGRHQAAATRAAMEAMQGRIQSMALLHETLYRSGTFAAVDLGAYLRKIVEGSSRVFAARPGPVAFEHDLVSAQVSLDLAMPCGLLVNELLSNALKHAFPDDRAGRVRVELQPVAGRPALRMSVSDNGVGLPADFAARRGVSLGLQLVSDLTRQIGGTLEVASGQGPGASFVVTFPIHAALAVTEALSARAPL